MIMNKYFERLYNGIIKENPVLILLLGMCPTLAVSTRAMNGIGMGIGFTIALTIAGLIREILGNGTAFEMRIIPESVEPIGIFVQPPGAFLVLAFIIAVMNAVGIKTRQRQLVEEGCDGKCSSCAASCMNKKEEVAE